MGVVAWVVVVGILSAWWVWRFDLPDRNPFLILRVYRLVVLGLCLLFVAVLYKAVVYRTELRFVIQSCR